MILSDITIMKLADEGLIQPFDMKQLQPASYDLTLGQLPSLRDTYLLRPKEFILASTLERVSIPGTLVARIEGKSTWARKGLVIHTAGFIDPGFQGQLTLEMTNLSNTPILLELGKRIAQIAFQLMDKVPVRLYGDPDLGSHYQGQQGITEAASV